MADPASDDLKASIAEALEESEYETEDQSDQKSWDDWESEGGTPPAEAAAGNEDLSSKDEPQVTKDGAESTDSDEPPMDYWGVTLEGIPAEKRAEIIAHFEQQDSTINKLHARLSQEPEPVEPVEPSEQEDITDEALMQALGIDPESYEAQSLAPTVLPLARTVLALEETVEQMKTKDLVEDTKTTWNSQLDQLESTFGKLPFDRVQVLRYAVEEKLVTPADTYFKLVAGPAGEVRDAVKAARLEAAKKEQSAGVKPRNTSGTRSADIDPKTTSLRDAVKIAMKEAETETGLSFKDIFGKRVKRPS